MSSVSECTLELQKISADLAKVQDDLAMPRLARRGVRDRISEACVKRDRVENVVKSWRPPSPDEVREIDEVHQRTAPIIAELMPIEASLKAAKRAAEIDLQNAKKLAKKNRAQPGENRGKTGEIEGLKSSPVNRRTLKGLGTGEAGPPVPPAKPGKTGESPVFFDGSGCRQGELF